MKQQIPSYIIKYIQCQQEGHQGEKVNLICLNTECHESSLICSLCTPKHRGHTYKPIKIYLDELYRKYKAGGVEQRQDIDELEKRKLLLLHNLRVCVEKISEAFMALEEDIIFTYDKIKNQIHQNESRKSKFAQFYLSMIKDNYGDPHFQVRNYLHKEEINIFTDQNIFDDLIRIVEKEVKSVRKNFINVQSLDKVEDKVVEQKNEKAGEYLMPPNIKREGELFTQTILTANSPNLCLYNLDIGQWMGKLRFQIISLQAGAKVTLGLMRLADYKNAKEIYKEGVHSFYVDSLGKSKGVQYSHIGVLTSTSVIDCFLKKNNFRMVCKNNNAIMNLGDKNYCFFFAMEGNCKVKITYPFLK